MGQYSFRNFDIENQFGKEFKKCKLKPSEKTKCEIEVRGRYKTVESNRLHQMGDKIHNFISALDPDEVTTFKNKFPSMVKVANEFAIVEELREF